MAAECDGMNSSSTTAALAAAAHGRLLAAVQSDRQHIASLCEEVVSSQHALDMLHIEHTAEAIDGRLLSDKMTTRLAAAQAVQAAAVAKQAAMAACDVQLVRWEGQLGLRSAAVAIDDGGGAVAVTGDSKMSDGEDGDDEAYAMTLLAPLEELRARQRSEREALAAAIERERQGREAHEAEELDEARTTLEVARQRLRLAQAPNHTELSAGGGGENVGGSNATVAGVARRSNETASPPPPPQPTGIHAALKAAVAAAVAVQREKEARAVQAAQTEAAEAHAAAQHAERQLKQTRMALAGGVLGRIALFEGLGGDSPGSPTDAPTE